MNELERSINITQNLLSMNMKRVLIEYEQYLKDQSFSNISEMLAKFNSCVGYSIELMKLKLEQEEIE